MVDGRGHRESSDPTPGKGDSDEGTHVVFGASGGAGSAVVRALHARGRPVRAVTRSGAEGLPPGAEDHRADAMDLESVRRACRGAVAVHHCINVPYATWDEILPTVMENLIVAAGEADATLVYCDNLYMYGPQEGPLTEETPMTPPGPKGELRVRLAESLLEAHASGRVRATTGRGSDFFGPGGANTVAGMLVFPAVLQGKKAHWVGALDQPHTMSYLDDFARGLLTLADDPRSLGEAWHIPAGPPLTGREFIEAAFRVAGGRPRVGVYPRWMIRLVGLFDRQMRELVEVMYQFEQPFIMASDRYGDTFGPLELTPLDDALGASLAWHRKGTSEG